MLVSLGPGHKVLDYTKPCPEIFKVIISNILNFYASDLCLTLEVLRGLSRQLSAILNVTWALIQYKEDILPV